MSTVKSKRIQLGVSETSTNNFTIYQPSVPDGTLRIGQGTADNPTEVVKVDGSGNLTPTGGIYLGGTGSANLLDDYEYGTFDPNFNEGGNTLTTSSQSGQYVKVGKMVFAYMQVGNITKSGTGTLKFDLPFVVDGFAIGNVQFNRLNFATNDKYVTLYALNNSADTALYFPQTGNANASVVIASDIADGVNADVIASITYKTD